MPTTPFPLNIINKEDSPARLEKLAGVDPKFYLTAEETNEIVAALNFLNETDNISQYQSYLNTTTDNPPLSEQEWSDSFKYAFEEILLSVRKIGNGSNNKAFRLARSKNYETDSKDIYFDANGFISDNSLVEGGDTFLNWAGQNTLYVITWYNQSKNGSVFNANSQIEWNFVGGSNIPPIYIKESNEIRWDGNNLMTFNNIFNAKKIYRAFSIIKNERITTEAVTFPLEYWGKFVYQQTFRTTNEGYYNGVESDSILFFSPLNVYILYNKLQNIGGSKGGDGVYSCNVRLNKNNISVNKMRDGQSESTLWGITGGAIGKNYIFRKEFRIYNYDISNSIEIDNDMFNFMNI